jgi:hypothetical protein
MSIPRAGLGLAILLVISATSASAQTSGMICGTVTSASGARVVGVTVALAKTPSTRGSSGTAETPSAPATTDSKGGYGFPNVPVGTYSLFFELTGFATKNVPQVVIKDGFGQRIDVLLAERSVSPSRGTFTREQDTVSNVPFAMNSPGATPPCAAQAPSHPDLSGTWVRADPPRTPTTLPVAPPFGQEVVISQSGYQHDSFQITGRPQVHIGSGSVKAGPWSTRAFYDGDALVYEISQPTTMKSFSEKGAPPAESPITLTTRYDLRLNGGQLVVRRTAAPMDTAMKDSTAVPSKSSTLVGIYVRKKLAAMPVPETIR